jgi:hypothetical protein
MSSTTAPIAPQQATSANNVAAMTATTTAPTTFPNMTPAQFGQRIAQNIPRGWLSQSALFNGIASLKFLTIGQQLQFVYQGMQYALKAQRLAGETSPELDNASLDYFGSVVGPLSVLALPRKAGQSDSSYLSQISSRLLARGVTRDNIIADVKAFSGAILTLFEPRRPADTGAYGTGQEAVFQNLAYNVAGGYGSLELPYQAFGQISAVPGLLVPNVMGYYPPAPTFPSPPTALGGYGVGAISYINASGSSTTPTQAQIFEYISDLILAGTVLWIANITGAIASGLGLSTNSSRQIVVNNTQGWPGSSSGLNAGQLFNNNGIATCVDPTALSPNADAPKVYFGATTAAGLLRVGGFNLPQTDPGVSGQLWINGGIVQASATASSFSGDFSQDFG